MLTWVPSFKHRDHNSHVALRISHAPQLGSFPLALLRIISLALTVLRPLIEFATVEELLERMSAEVIAPAEEKHQARQKLLEELFNEA